MNKIRVIDLLNKIANNEELPEKIKYYGNIYYKYNHNGYFYAIGWEEETLLDDIQCTSQLNDEIEIIEEETTYEQNFTGWQIIQNGKVVASYNAQRLKPADVVDVEKDIKEMLEEKPKKIEECKSYENFEGIDDYIEHLRSKMNELAKKANYLLEKESDK